MQLLPRVGDERHPPRHAPLLAVAALQHVLNSRSARSIALAFLVLHVSACSPTWAALAAGADALPLLRRPVWRVLEDNLV